MDQAILKLYKEHVLKVIDTMEDVGVSYTTLTDDHGLTVFNVAVEFGNVCKVGFRVMQPTSYPYVVATLSQVATSTTYRIIDLETLAFVLSSIKMPKTIVRSIE